MKVKGEKSILVIFIVLIGAIGGTLIGEILGDKISALAFLKTAYNIGTQKPMIFDLKVINFSFGFNFNFNLMTIVGIILAIILCKRK